MDFISVSPALKVRNLNAYNGSEQKDAFHRAARAFLKKVAAALQLPSGSFDIRTNEGGIAVAGETHLHGETINAWLSNGAFGGETYLLYRSCNGRKDHSGGANHTVDIKDLCDERAQSQVLTDMHRVSQAGLAMEPAAQEAAPSRRPRI